MKLSWDGPSKVVTAIFRLATRRAGNSVFDAGCACTHTRFSASVDVLTSDGFAIKPRMIWFLLTFDLLSPSGVYGHDFSPAIKTHSRVTMHALNGS